MIVFALGGIGWRCWRGTGWMFARSEGLVRPNSATVSQALFATYAICEFWRTGRRELS